MQRIVHVGEKENGVRCNNTMYTGYAKKKKKKTLTILGGFLRLASRSPQPCFCFFCCCLHSEAGARDNTRYDDVSLPHSLHTIYVTCMCVCVAMKSLTWKHLTSFFYEWTLYRNCTILLLSICTHLHTYVHTYTHMHWTTVFAGEHVFFSP